LAAVDSGEEVKRPLALEAVLDVLLGRLDVPVATCAKYRGVEARRTALLREIPQKEV
jgi:hypothetical protein